MKRAIETLFLYIVFMISWILFVPPFVLLGLFIVFLPIVVVLDVFAHGAQPSMTEQFICMYRRLPIIPSCSS